MTKEEAIEIIECGDISNRWGKDGEEVEKMAIKALKQEPCEDAISRKAVLDVVNNPLNVRLDAIIKQLPPVVTKEERALLQRWRDNRGVSMEEFAKALELLKEDKA